jgi:hypothetical protein
MVHHRSSKLIYKRHGAAPRLGRRTKECMQTFLLEQEQYLVTGQVLLRNKGFRVFIFFTY